MRTILFVVVLAVAAPCSANTINLWYGSAQEPTIPGVHAFRLSTSSTAYIEHVGSAADVNTFHGIYHASDGPNIAAFFADLTNGVNNPITWSTSAWSYIMDENYFFTATPTPPPLLGFSPLSQNGISPTDINLAEFLIESVEVNMFGQSYWVSVDGHFPEPSSGLLFLLGLGCCGLHGIRTAAR